MSGYWDAGDPTKLTAGQLAYYLCTNTVNCAKTGTSSFWRLSARKNGAESLPPSHTVQMDNASDDLTLACVRRLDDGDFIEYVVDHNNSANVAVDINSAVGSIAHISTEGAEVSRVATQTFAHNTAALVSFDTEDVDDNNYFSAGTPTRLTIPATGWYVVGCSVRNPTVSLTCSLTARLNGTTDLVTASHDGARDVAVCLPYYFTAGDFIEFNFLHTSSGSSPSNQRACNARAWIAFRPNGVGAFATRATTQAVAASTTAAIQMTAEVRDDGLMLDLGAHNTRATAPADGWYMVGGYLRFTNHSGFYESFLRKNGTEQIAGSDNSQNSAAGTYQNPSLAVYLSSGDYVELCYVNTSGFSRSPGPAALWMLRVGAPE